MLDVSTTISNHPRVHAALAIWYVTSVNCKHPYSKRVLAARIPIQLSILLIEEIYPHFPQQPERLAIAQYTPLSLDRDP